MGFQEEQKEVEFAMKIAVGGGVSRCVDAQARLLCREG